MSAAFSPSSRMPAAKPCSSRRLSLGGFLLAASPAKADLRLCNMTSSRVGIALGYRDAQGWVTEGWWNLNVPRLRDPAEGPARRALLLHLRHRLRPRRRMERTLLHVHARAGIHRSAERRIASPEASIAAASSKSIRVSRRAGRSSSPKRTAQGGNDDETRTAHEDSRNLGTGFREPRDDRQAVPGRRRRLPPQHEPSAPRAPEGAGRDDPRRRGQVQAPHRHPRRPAGPEAARRHVRGRQRHAGAGPDLHPRCRQDARHREARAPAPSRDPVLARARPHDPDRRRQAAAAREEREGGLGHHRRSRSPARSPTARA